MDKFNLKEYLKNNPLLKEEMEVDRFDYDDPNSPLAQLNDDDNAVNMLNDLISKYGKDVVQYWVTSGEYYEEDYLQENKTLNELELDFYDEDDPNAVTLTAQSGEYDGDVEDGMVSFSVYDDEEEFDEDYWEDILGSNHAFVKINKLIPTEVEADGDYVQITVKIDDLKGIAK